MTETIFAPSTALGQAGIAVIRISGPQVKSVLKKHTLLKEYKARYAHMTYWISGKEKTDQVIVIYYSAPHSFTGEDVAEIQCHGSRAVIQQILQDMSACPSCRMAQAGEFTRRALYNNKMDLTQAEGLLDLIHSQTKEQARWAMRQMGGELGQIYQNWRQDLIKICAQVEAYIDFPEEEITGQYAADIQKLLNQIHQHIEQGEKGLKLAQGLLCVIAGEPNVGKSSLLNALLKKDVAIVSTTAGTTRDVIQAQVDLEGYPVIIADTAGLRKTQASLEKEGIRRAKDYVKKSDILIYVMDSTQKAQVIPAWVQKHPCALIVYNKGDKKEHDGLCISAKTGKNIDVLQNKLRKKVVDMMSSSTPFLTHERYKETLQKCCESLQQSLKASEIELIAEHLHRAIRLLGEITGYVRVDEILDQVFSTFCIGK
ncbi:MAG: tRNA uridine-5-carboxymethylaminomethyl(34) synthesis GTPase MnmE [Alphaproteobacteria bacterium]|nr:tRNA uridine-5-carboxymethylaminomethyl(34) synthesis GTPase MnmE [Alphaproteobacteria bacterium]